MAEDRQKMLEAAAVQMYSHLSNSIQTNVDIIMPIVEDSACIWTGSGFVKPGLVVMGSAVNFQPYLFSLPQAVLPYRGLLVIFKVLLCRHCMYLLP